MKFLRKLLAGLLVVFVTLASGSLETVAWSPYTDFPDQSLREWPTKDSNYVASALPAPPAIANTVDMADMFHYPQLIYTGSISDDAVQTGKLARNRSYVTDIDTSVAVITRDARWQSGVMWSLEENKIKLNEPFQMVSYVYLGNRTQYDKNFNGLGGADGITFTMHNDRKSIADMQAGSKIGSGDLSNTGINAYGALGNGLGVYGSNFSANVSSEKNNMVDFWRGVENGITLEFDTFFNDNDTTQHSDNDLTSIIYNENHSNTQYGHIAINLLNDFKNNRANYNKEPDKTANKHKIKLSLGWDGEVADKTNPYSWNISNWPTSSLADGRWHRLEVTWTPDTASNTGNLNYTIYKQGHEGSRNIEYSDDRSKDGTDVISYDVAIGTGDYSLEKVFGISDLNHTVYWGFSGSTGGFLNNQAVQMVQLPISYYNAELRKEDQDGNLVSDAIFEIEKKNPDTGEWIPLEFYNPRTGRTVSQISTGSHRFYQGVVGEEGILKLSQLTEGTYRWKEIAAPEGYQLDQVYYPNEDGFVVNYAESLKENAFVYTATNKKLYQLELIKTDADTGQAINDVPFVISKIENDISHYLKIKADNTGFDWTRIEGEAKQFLSGKSYSIRADGQVSEQIGEDGKISIQYFPDAPNLFWKEVSVPTGYNSKTILSGAFTTVADNKYSYTASQRNERLFQINLEKKGSDTNAALQGAVFALQEKVGSEWIPISYSGKAEFTTNLEGKISIPNLAAGRYRWEEKQAPVGYQLGQQYYPNEDGFVVAYREGLEVDQVYHNYIFDTTTVTNQPKDFELFLEKKSSTFQRPLENVEFKLYSTRNGDTFSGELARVRTNSEGKIVFGKDILKADKTYYLVESQTIDGFIRLEGYFTITTSKTDGINITYTKADGEKDSRPFEFTRADDTIYKGTLAVYNKRKSILPITGGNGIVPYIVIGGSLTILALLFFTRKRFVKWLFVIIIATTGLIGQNTRIFAQEQGQVTIEVNRLIYPVTDTQYKSGSPVAGAYLEIVDVTNEFYDLVHLKSLSRLGAQETLSKAQNAQGEKVGQAVTDDKGKAYFTVEKISRDHPAVYLIRETVTPVAVTPMEPLVVVLPLLDDQGKERSQISVYPKAQGTFTFDKTIDGKRASYSLGEPIHYRLSTILPQDIVNLASYELEDVYDVGLEFISESLRVSIDGQEQAGLIESISQSENRFKLSFDIAKLAQFGGKTLDLTYNMVITDEAAIDQPLINTATLYPGDLTPLVDREQVITGGFRFIKQKAGGNKDPLANAKFIIKHPANQTILTYKEGRYQFEKVAPEEKDVVQLTSDAQGHFEIKGLSYGTYLLSEIQAPSGYILNENPTTFTISTSTFTKGPILSIYNVEKPRIQLPKTGTAATSLAAIGLLCLVSSIMMNRSRCSSKKEKYNEKV